MDYNSKKIITFVIQNSNPMSSFENSIKKIGKFVREISVIVIGVAITLYASYWLSGKNEKRDMVLYLNAIKLELEENMEHIDGIVKRMKPNVRYTEYVRIHDKKSLNKDSIESYTEVVHSLEHNVAFKTAAFEMFKGSGIMRLINDKELLLSLWNVYQELDLLTEVLDWYFQIRVEELKKEFSLILENQTVDIPMYFFYATGTPILLMTPAEKTLMTLKDMVSKLEKLL